MNSNYGAIVTQEGRSKQQGNTKHATVQELLNRRPQPSKYPVCQIRKSAGLLHMHYKYGIFITSCFLGCGRLGLDSEAEARNPKCYPSEHPRSQCLSLLEQVAYAQLQVVAWLKQGRSRSRNLQPVSLSRQRRTPRKQAKLTEPL